MTVTAVDTIRRLAEFEAWANARVLAAVRAAPPESRERALNLLAHVAHGLRVWYERVRDEDSGVGSWEPLSLDQCAEELSNQQSAWAALLAEEHDLARLIRYERSGTLYETPLRDIVVHLAFHSHYHRGQINEALRQAGAGTVNVDFMMFVREGR
jgi:uncharacterized damage-inducible protein DinB